MTTPFQITEPGYYRTRDGRKAWAAPNPFSADSFVIGGWIDSRRDGVQEWQRNGLYFREGECPEDLIAPWTDAPILAKPAVFKVGDRVRAKCNVYPTGMATQLIDKGTECSIAAIPSARHLIFTLGGYRYPADCFELVPEPTPFRIDRVGVYRRRDGGEELVTKHNALGTLWGNDVEGSALWYSSGRRDSWKEKPGDLVAYLRPLDEPEPAEEKPRYKHDCDKCVFLGSHADHRTVYDLYYCSRFEHSHLVAKDGDEHWEELRGDAGTTIPILIEAELRARERGLLKEPEPSPEATAGMADGGEPVRVNDGGPAFPGQQPTGFDPRSGNFNEGMTLRDYFAGQALVSIGSHQVNGLGWKLTGDLAYTRGEWKTSPKMQAEAAYRIADAMLTEAARREKEPT